MLLTPALEIILVAAYCEPLGRLLFPGDAYAGLSVLIYNLAVALALSMALGAWEGWRFPHCANRADQVSAGVHFGLGIAIVNAGIAFAGCTALKGELNL